MTTPLFLRNEEALRLMIRLHVGDRVMHADRLCAVHGLSPMSTVPMRVLLEDVETGAIMEANADDIQLLPPPPDETATAERP
jgi:hypothetical protein